MAHQEGGCTLERQAEGEDDDAEADDRGLLGVEGEAGDPDDGHPDRAQREPEAEASTEDRPRRLWLLGQLAGGEGDHSDVGQDDEHRHEVGDGGQLAVGTRPQTGGEQAERHQPGGEAGEVRRHRGDARRGDAPVQRR